MALALVGFQNAASATGQIPVAATSGNLLVAFAQRNNATAASLASGWTSKLAATGSSNSVLIAWKIMAPGESNPVFTNANEVDIWAFSGHDATTPLGASAQANATSNSINFPGVALQITDGSSWVLTGAAATRPDVVIPTPTGYTFREATGTRPAYAGFDTNGGVSSSSNAAVSVSRPDLWCTASVEVRAVALSAVNVARALPYTVRKIAPVVRAMPYTMISRVLLLRNTPYTVRKLVTVDRALPSTVRRLVPISRSTPYSVVGRVLILRNLVYGVAGKVSVLRALPFTVRRSVPISRSLPYTVRRLASTIRSLPYSIISRVTVLRRVPYFVAGKVAMVRAIPYTIRNLTTITRALPYTIRKLATVSRSLPYSVKRFVQALRRMPYGIAGKATVLRRLPYSMTSVASTIRRLLFEVHGMDNNLLLKIKFVEPNSLYRLLVAVGVPRASVLESMNRVVSAQQDNVAVVQVVPPKVVRVSSNSYSAVVSIPGTPVAVVREN